MDILPAIDLRDGRCVRLLQGNYDREIPYSDDPVAQARQFADAGARWLHVVDLDGAKEGRLQNLDVIRRLIKDTPLQVEVGGGIRDEAVVDSLLDIGASRVVIGTRALEDMDWFRQLVQETHRSQRVALGLDSREGKLAVRGWTEVTDRAAIDVAEAVAGWPVAAIIYTDISRDGMLLGPNLEATRSLATVSAIPVIASGGVTDIDDVRHLAEMPLAGIIIGRAIYEKQLDLAEAIRVAEMG
jgi:phosphoribosylformimino-5-aminoimidazole carboxamide ribotide isomerase